MKPTQRIALFAAITLSCAAYAAEWQTLIETADARLALNPEGRKTAAGVHTVEYRIDFKQPRKLPDGKAVSSSTMTVMVSCPAQTVALTQTVAHAEAGGKGAVAMRDKVATPVANRVMPGSSDELVYKAVCAPAAAPAKPAAPAPAPAKK
jgi:hypothetical protein